MRMTSVHAETARMDFAKLAAKHFAENPKHWTFGELTPGSLLAIRWGLGEDCVLVIRQDDEEPVNFQNIIEGVIARSVRGDRLRAALDALFIEVESEIEQRKTSGLDEDWKPLQLLVDKVREALP